GDGVAVLDKVYSASFGNTGQPTAPLDTNTRLTGKFVAPAFADSNTWYVTDATMGAASGSSAVSFFRKNGAGDYTFADQMKTGTGGALIQSATAVAAAGPAVYVVSPAKDALTVFTKAGSSYVLAQRLQD